MNQRSLFGELLSEAREKVMIHIWRTGGIICPCCDGIAKVRRRKLSTTLARHLILIYQWNHSAPGKFNHIKNRMIGESLKWFNGEYARLADYHLIEAAHDVRPDGNPDNGYYRITQRGIDFVEGRIEVPAFAQCYKGKVLEFSDETVDIATALDRPFQYWELWQEARSV